MKTKTSQIRQLLCLFLICLIFSTCGTVSSKSGGVGDDAYLVLSSTQKYYGHTVLLSIDDNIPLEVSVSRDGNWAVRKGHRLAITPGKHHILVKDKQGRLLYDRQIFVSTRNTRTIVLP